MRVGIQTWGSEGDMRPLFALAEGLGRAGHDVTLQYASADERDYTERLANASFRAEKVGSLGLSHEQLRELCAPGFLDPNPIRQLRNTFEKLFDPFVDDLIAAAIELAQRSDVLVYHGVAHTAAAAAEKAGKPAIGLYPAPLFPMRALPLPGAPNLGFLNVWAWRLGLSMFDATLLPSVSRVRKAMGLSTVRRARDQHDKSAFDLLTVSPSLIPRSSEWPEKMKTCGFLNPGQPPRTSELPEDLKAFLEEGPPPVFVTFGSMSDVDPDRDGVFEMVVEAVDGVGCRAILQTGTAARPARVPHPRVLRIGAISHDEVFPRCAAIVHHGGSGTTQAAMRAGKPSVIVAYLADQFLWGEVLRLRGVSPPHLNRRSVDARKLSSAIQSVRLDPRMSQAAATLGEKMRREDGVAEAVRLIETLAP